MVHVFRKQQQRQANALLQRMLSISHREQSLESLELELGRTIASTAFDMIYGYPLAVADDPFLLDQMTLTANLAKAVMPSNFLVNVLPFLAYVPAWLPGAGWKKTALEWRKQKDHTIDSIFNWTKTQIANGADDHSITATALMELQQLGYNQDDADEFAKNFSEALYEGATDTSTSSLLAFLLAMMLYPETQLKAQKEVDSVIGQDRLPTIEDRANLPYINALILEVLRWEPALPLAIPHVCTEDNEYRGYRIPKGAVVFGNIWSISHDEKTYNDPELFNPARFLDPDTPVPPIFGWGRRICPGNHFAQEMLFIIISSILAAFTISNTGGESVEENYLLVEGEGSSLTYKATSIPRIDSWCMVAEAACNSTVFLLRPTPPATSPGAYYLPTQPSPLSPEPRPVVEIETPSPPPRKANAAFVFLARNSDLKGVMQSMKHMEDRFNKKFDYPYVFLNDVPFDKRFKYHTSQLTNANVSYGVIESSHWNQPDWVDEEYATSMRKWMKENNIIYGEQNLADTRYE
ncbi:cytochrome P450 family protein [Ceratobasidium sp. AG-Ba]|nr:cytochrome P450 family protein [Ceratobasidium sp. AG-Ba]